ncbi:hypothetical protein FisN_5Lh514 [Fistulifera solaris]|uniref:Uncharacterized protein n=1 Tax=Fistulifera solaris TaxID=1519565 RepID=A0A1Z5KHA5_FISSO|nr:hypothetical protein FisN_5Lh514 [Fistulifera solaris]|eukprot:GAX25411.1 hypothetical protein FisN_5Lh514 [Fistulifera solaris]
MTKKNAVFIVHGYRKKCNTINMEPLELKLSLLVEELTSLDGLLSDEQPRPNSGVLCSVLDIENAVNEVFPHHQSERHSLRRCLRHFIRCLTQIQQIQGKYFAAESHAQNDTFSISDKLQNNLIQLVTKLKFPFDDDYALELATTVLNTTSEILAGSIVSYHPEHLHFILCRILQYGEEHQMQRRKTSSFESSICLPWLKILTHHWDIYEENSQGGKDCFSPGNNPREHNPRQYSAESLTQYIRDLRSAIKTASMWFKEEEASASETVLLWHNLIVLMIRQLLSMTYGKSTNEDSVHSNGERSSVFGSFMDQNEKSADKNGTSTELFHLWSDVEMYIYDLVEMTLDKIDSAMSISTQHQVDMPPDKASTSLEPSVLGASENTDASSIGRIVYTAVRLAVIASDAIELFATSSHFNQQSALKLSAKLWKGLATAFVNEIDLSFADQLDVSFCASVLSVADVCLGIDLESVPSSTLLVTFLRSIKFPDLLLDSEALWRAMKHHLAKTDHKDLKHGVQAAALRTQQIVTCHANKLSQNRDDSASIEKYEMLRTIIERITDILPTSSSSSTPDPWDEYFWGFMTKPSS